MNSNADIGRQITSACTEKWVAKLISMCFLCRYDAMIEEQAERVRATVEEYFDYGYQVTELGREIVQPQFKVRDTSVENGYTRRTEFISLSCATRCEL